jgi:hypothetical protein
VSDCDGYGQSLSFYSLLLKAGATIVAQIKEDTESLNYVYELRPKHIIHFNPSERREISANCNCRRFCDQANQADKSNPFASDDRTKSLRDLAVGRTAARL